MRRARQKGGQAVLVTKPENVYYLSGFTGEDSWLIIAGRRRILVTDSRFTEEATLSCPEWQIHSRKGPIAAEAGGLLKHLGLPTAFEGGNLSVDTRGLLAGEIRRKAQLLSTSGLVEGLRLRKDRLEIRAIRRAVAAAESALKSTLRHTRAADDESAFAAALDYNMRLEGAESSAFPTIVAGEPASSLPHAKPGKKRIYDSPSLLLDWGARVARYNSDLTRVVWWGKVLPQIARIWRAAREAQRAALKVIRPGVLASRADAAARRVIADAGYGEFFGHGLGHGVGLEVHEGPTLSPRSQLRLAEGMVVTVEPGIYLPGVGGVRVEDMVLVTAGGAEILTHVARDPRVLGDLAGKSRR